MLVSFYLISKLISYAEEEVNVDLAFKYLKEASLNHHSEAQMLLASYYKMHGNGLMTMAWLLELSSLGSMEACNEIVDLWLEGSSDNTVKPDPFKAIMNIVKLRDANYPEWQVKWDIAVEALKKDPRYSNDINKIINNI